MRRMKQLIVGVALLASAALLGVLATSTAVDAQPPQGSAPVTIVAPLPLPVRVVDAAAKELFQIGSDLKIFDEYTGAVTLVTVPAGKRLVIEHVSAWIESAVSGGLTSAGLSAGNEIDFVDCRLMGDDVNGRSNFACSAQTKYIVEPGRTLVFYAATTAGAGGALRALVSGYYIPLP